jgi:hypothetical protein
VHRLAVVILDLSAALIVSGGFYDVFTPALPPNIRARCGTDQAAQELVRALLRALGGCLIAIGIAVGVLANWPAREGKNWPLALVLILVLPSEGLNGWGMRRVGSPYYVPLTFILLAILGVVMAAAARPS